MDCTIPTLHGSLLVSRVVRQGLREYQEDASGVVRVPGFPLTLCAILDGMGGQEGGGLTARLGLQLITSKFLSFLSLKSPPALDVIAEDCIRYAQHQVAQMANEEWVPGATALVGILDDEGYLEHFTNEMP